MERFQNDPELKALQEQMEQLRNHPVMKGYQEQMEYFQNNMELKNDPRRNGETSKTIQC
ncbi:hypothetical protein ACFS3C_08980 [Azotobacter vinelandii]